jgi:hypothetical protein
VVGIGIALYTIPELRQQKYISAGEPHRTQKKNDETKDVNRLCIVSGGNPRSLPDWMITRRELSPFVSSLPLSLLYTYSWV